MLDKGVITDVRHAYIKFSAAQQNACRTPCAPHKVRRQLSSVGVNCYKGVAPKVCTATGNQGHACLLMVQRVKALTLGMAKLDNSWKIQFDDKRTMAVRLRFDIKKLRKLRPQSGSAAMHQPINTPLSNSASTCCSPPFASAAARPCAPASSSA